MGRIILTICGAALALGLLGASAPQEKAAERPGSQADQPKTNAQPALPMDPLAERLAKACERGQDDRSSDLCAQWKAADSAYEAAVWTRLTAILTAIGLIVGAVTMIAAIFAALFAKDAAGHTKRSADAAEKQLASADRPHLLLDEVTFGPLRGLADGHSIPLALKYTNHGRGPGWMREWGVKVAMGPKDKVPVFSFAEETFKPFKVAWTLSPQGGFWTLHASPDTNVPTDPGQIAKVRDGEWAAYVGLMVRYADAERVVHTNLTVLEYEQRNDRLIPVEHPFARYD